DAHTRCGVNRANAAVGGVVERDPNIAASPVRAHSANANPNLISRLRAASEPIVGLEDDRPVHASRIGLLIGREAGSRRIWISSRRGRAPGKLLRFEIQLAGIVFFDGSNADRML